MKPLPAVLLHHTTRHGAHYDLLIALPPGARDPRPSPRHTLWAARTAWASDAWARRGAILLQPLPLHRRLYLTHQGPIGGARGAVRRVDQGHALARLWGVRRLVVQLHLRGFVGRLDARRLPGGAWLGRVEPGATAGLDRGSCRWAAVGVESF